MRRAVVWSLMVFLRVGTVSQVDAMSSEIPVASLKTYPELAIDMLNAQIGALVPLQKQLAGCATLREKCALISQLPAVQAYFHENKALEAKINALQLEQQYVLKTCVALGQGPLLFTGSTSEASLQTLADKLYPSERFYSYMGGLVGYQIKTLQLIVEQLAKKQEPEAAKLMIPPVTDIRADSQEKRAMVKEGILSLGDIAELYVVGGAGDRLALVDQKTKMPLPVARLNFQGYTLLENLVRDLEAREYLAYRLQGKQIVTPIVLMTSHEKQNDAQIEAILKERGYFGRPVKSIYRIVQPMTPVVAVDGKWAASASCEPILKPGGHGVIWKLADEYGAYTFLEEQNRRYLVVRQINNPLAGLDSNLFALAGYGKLNKKSFGFESVARLPNMSEGMNVLKETADGRAISNLEYTEFAKAKASDKAFGEIADSLDFPANTNILFADVQAVQKAVKKLPVPGYLVNMKQPVETLRDGVKVSLPGARLESTMQNLADAITSKPDEPLATFVLLNERNKTISVTKKAYDGKSLAETPEGCFNDLMKENLRMLRTNCGFDVDAEHVGTVFQYHPALGPLYSIIGQKLSKGKIAPGSEFVLEASEVMIRNLDLNGSFKIIADQVTGQIDPATAHRVFGPQVGRVVLENVTVRNSARKECATIKLLGSSEFVAKDVVLDGSIELVVPDNTRMRVASGPNGTLSITKEPLNKPFSWNYSFDGDNNVKLHTSE